MVSTGLLVHPLDEYPCRQLPMTPTALEPCPCAPQCGFPGDVNGIVWSHDIFNLEVQKLSKTQNPPEPFGQWTLWLAWHFALHVDNVPIKPEKQHIQRLTFVISCLDLKLNRHTSGIVVVKQVNSMSNKVNLNIYPQVSLIFEIFLFYRCFFYSKNFIGKCTRSIWSCLAILFDQSLRTMQSQLPSKWL